MLLVEAWARKPDPNPNFGNFSPRTKKSRGGFMTNANVLLLIALSAAVLTVVTGCVGPYDSRPPVYAQRPPVARNPSPTRNQQLNAAQAKDIASLRADLRAVQEEVRQLRGQLAAAAQQNRQITQDLTRANTRTENVETRLTAIEHTLQNRLAAVEKTLTTESKAREKAIKDLLAAVSQEISQLANKLHRDHTVSPDSTGVNQGVYTVQRGDTLSEIAKAFGVTVSAIKTANNLNTDVIRDGRKLTIPPKKKP